jgi:hypothetical protein
MSLVVYNNRHYLYETAKSQQVRSNSLERTKIDVVYQLRYHRWND